MKYSLGKKKNMILEDRDRKKGIFLLVCSSSADKQRGLDKAEAGSWELSLRPSCELRDPSPSSALCTGGPEQNQATEAVFQLLHEILMPKHFLQAHNWSVFKI